jgi:DNA-binding PadR family transcriptional regulator
MDDPAELNDLRKALQGQLDEMKRQHRDRQIECRDVARAEYDEIRQLPREERQARKKALEERLVGIRQLHHEQQEQRKALEDRLKEIKRRQTEEGIERKKTLREQLVEKMELAREEHTKKRHSREFELLPDYCDSEVRKGFLKLHILGVLAEGPSHGYEIMHRISHHTGHMWRPSPGSMYPALETLESNGFISCQGQEDGRRKVYSLTQKGQDVLVHMKKKREEQMAEMKAFMSALFGE